LSVIRTAFSDGKRIEVFATESRPWRQGLLTVNELAREGIPTARFGTLGFFAPPTCLKWK
jgi:methylthioribose-1-phosphate isomerase